MPSLHRSALFFCASLAVAASSACAQRSPSPLPMTNQMLPLATAEGKTSPPACKDQKTTKQYAMVDEQLHAAGGKACIPSFGGFGGKMSYPSLKPAIGITLMAIHLFGIQITGVSVNPARSLGPAIFVQGQALKQLWLFLVFPSMGGIVAGLFFRTKLLAAD